MNYFFYLFPHRPVQWGKKNDIIDKYGHISKHFHHDTKKIWLKTACPPQMQPESNSCMNFCKQVSPTFSTALFRMLERKINETVTLKTTTTDSHTEYIHRVEKWLQPKLPSQPCFPNRCSLKSGRKKTRRRRSRTDTTEMCNSRGVFGRCVCTHLFLSVRRPNSEHYVSIRRVIGEARA